MGENERKLVDLPECAGKIDRSATVFLLSRSASRTIRWNIHCSLGRRLEMAELQSPEPLNKQ